MEIELLLNVLTVLEIIWVEFASIWLLSQKKHSFPVVFGVYAGITVVLLVFMLLIAVRQSGYGNGSGRFMVLGLFYFIPAMLHFGGCWKNRLIIAFYSFSYGLAGFAVGVRIAYLFPAEWLSAAAFISQTLVFLLTLPFYLRFSRKYLMDYISKTDNRQKNLLIHSTITSFFLIILYNNTMVIETSPVRKLLIYLLLVYFIILSYKLIVSYLQADDDNQALSRLAATDRLTGLGNRLALRDSAAEFFDRHEAFSLIFMDLNYFKTVNDRLGHQAGDLYLQNFAAALKTLSCEHTLFFRYSGDEFVALTDDAQLLCRLEGLNINAGEEFLGFSAGSASFPDDADTISKLLEIADQRMYVQKNAVHAKKESAL